MSTKVEKSSPSSIDSRNPVIECRNLWKIFGRRADEAMRAIESQGLNKDEIRDQYDCIVGVRDASFTVVQGSNNTSL